MMKLKCLWMRKFKSFELRSEKLKPIVFYKKKENYYWHVIKIKIPKYNISFRIVNKYPRNLI